MDKGLSQRTALYSLNENSFSLKSIRCSKGSEEYSFARITLEYSSCFSDIFEYDQSKLQCLSSCLAICLVSQTIALTLWTSERELIFLPTVRYTHKSNSSKVQ